MKLLIYFSCLVCFALLSSSCGVNNFFKLRESDRKFLKSFPAVENKPEFKRYHIKSNRIRYVEYGSDTLPVVLFIHGAPSSLSFWKNYFKHDSLANRAQLVAVDRPGYGYSSFGHLFLSYNKQAELLSPLIEKYGRRKLILVGSSYGGPLAALLAAQCPDLVKGVVLISSSIAPGEEAIWNITRVIDSPLGTYFPEVFQIATAEKLNHNRMLEEIKDQWSKVRCPLVMLHGTLDDLIYPSNVDFVLENFSKAPKRVSVMGGFKHNIAYGQVSRVSSKIIGLLENDEPNNLEAIK